VLALDGELCAVERIALVEPRLVGSDPDGLWVASAPGGLARSPWRLTRFERQTGAARASDFGALVALATDGRGTAFVLEQTCGGPASSSAADTLLWRVAADHRRTLLGAFPEGRALAVQAREVLVGCQGGELVLSRADGAVLATARLQAPVHALARGPRAGTWWSLDGEDRSLRLLSSDLAPRWSARVPPGTRRFAAVEGAERVWSVADGRAARLGPLGTVEVELPLPVDTWEVGLATEHGAFLFAPGAVLEVEVRHGLARVRRTQGGFAALVGLAAH
jgi:hypothetical protein